MGNFRVDGSTDGCAAICDTYAVIDHRFKVIHKSNGGVASARNAGLDIAAGEWIGFVDPDDYIERDMYEYLLALQFISQPIPTQMKKIAKPGLSLFKLCLYSISCVPIYTFGIIYNIISRNSEPHIRWTFCWNLLYRGIGKHMIRIF